MLKYLFRPFVFLVKELWGFLAALLLMFRTLLLLLLSFFLTGLLLSLPIFILLYYQGVDFTNIDPFRYVEQHSMSFLLSFFFIFLFFWRLLARSVPDGRYIPKASSMRLRRGMMLPLGKRSTTFIWKTSNRYKAIVAGSPYQGFYVEGSAGAGKSQSVVEPFIYQAVKQGFSGFLYDFKGNPPTLSSTLYGALTKYKPRTFCSYQSC